MRVKRKQRAFLPIALFAAVLVLTIGSIALAQRLRQAKIANPGEYTASDQIPRVTAAEAYQAAVKGEAVLIDTRTPDQFKTLHINGAINLPLGEVATRLTELDPHTWYITYCT